MWIEDNVEIGKKIVREDYTCSHQCCLLSSGSGLIQMSTEHETNKMSVIIGFTCIFSWVHLYRLNWTEHPLKIEQWNWKSMDRNQSSSNNPSISTMRLQYYSGGCKTVITFVECQWCFSCSITVSCPDTNDIVCAYFHQSAGCLVWPM